MLIKNGLIHFISKFKIIGKLTLQTLAAMAKNSRQSILKLEMQQKANSLNQSNLIIMTKKSNGSLPIMGTLVKYYQFFLLLHFFSIFRFYLLVVALPVHKRNIKSFPISINGSNFRKNFFLVQFHFHWGFNDYQGNYI